MAIRRSALLASVLGVCLAGALAGIVYMVRTVSRQTAEVERLSRENRELHALAGSLKSAPAQPLAPGAAPAAPVGRHPDARDASPDSAALVELLKRGVAEANANIAQLETRLQELRVESQRLALDNKRLTASEADLNDNLASANRLVSALQNELKTKSERVIQLEVANRKLHDESAAESKKLARLGQLSVEWQELQRRSEGLLSSILRRYREVTDQYRALAGVLENRAHAEGPAVPGADMARIQNSLSLAEDDLRQLNAINAQALRLARQIGGK
ncbi:MAG TPA: hypothetical protein VN442_25935 [Bryobacteraceae bacterium]|nr:hypothetical protein [Bryobacteraceae bacterium]